MPEVQASPTFVQAVPSADDPGLLVSTGQEVWLYRELPPAPVTHARVPEWRDTYASALLGVGRDLANMQGGRIRRRTLLRRGYRELHLLGVRTSRDYRPDPASPSAAELGEEFAGVRVAQQTVLLGVPLQATSMRRNLRSTIRDVAGTLIEGGATMADYQGDYERVGQIMRRHGLKVPTQEAVQATVGWWNDGRWPETIDLPHGDHMHVFTSFSSAQAAERALERGTDCIDWGRDLEGHRVLTLASLDEVQSGWELDSTDDVAAWASRLLHGGAVAVSIRGSLEPADVTRNEMRRHRRQYEDDIAKAQQLGRMDKSEADEAAAALASAERIYGAEAQMVPPTLTGARISVAMDGQWVDSTALGKGLGVTLVPRIGRQDFIRDEMSLGSFVRENPYLKDWPLQMVAASGLHDVAVVGDGSASPVIWGFTVGDHQPVGFTPTRASDEDSATMWLVAGASGSGKTMLLLRHAQQLSRAGLDVVSVAPKPMADASAVVDATPGAQSVSLSDLISADGILDPLRYNDDPEAAVHQAAANTLSINPWGTVEARGRVEVDLIDALHWAAARGAKSTGQALRAAKDAGVVDDDVVGPVLKLARSMPQARAFVGMSPEGPTLAGQPGWTHIQAGNMSLDLPEQGTVDRGETNVSQRVALTLIRALVNSCMFALRERGGTILLDEAWTFLLAGADELDRAGRLAREFSIDIGLFNQKVSEATRAGLSGYFVRGAVLAFADADEARTALELFDPALATGERVRKLTQRKTQGQGADAVPNWESMWHLEDPGTGRSLRGSIAYVIDFDDRVVPAELVLPAAFHRRATTNAAVLRRRRARHRGYS
ncbi:hypothetical protein GZ998_05490 [Actinomyces sp. 594]|uniref:ATP-binding protein n=1 Tax=Actinomyces sp. 594 TaxID=2057793 RepID=UPI001C5970A1|nr:ATP-binding protein [Actinomyces sp. 594]MBW3068966.1 hypothetical protein [Actinomyces sp. 594]